MKPLTLLCLALLAACQSQPSFPKLREFTIEEESFTGSVVFQKLTSTAGFKVILKNQSGEVTDQTIFRYIPYRFDTADINRDGKAEIIVGLSKATHFDPTEKKRLFILQIDNNHIRPLWLGSKVCQELIDFKVLTNGTIQTLERTNTGTLAIGLYYWQSFGLTLDKYLQHDISPSYANTIFRN